MYEYIKEVLRFELVLIVIPVEAILILDDSIQEMDVQQCLKKLLWVFQVVCCYLLFPARCENSIWKFGGKISLLRSYELWEPSMTATRNHVLYYPTNLVRLPHDRVIPLIYFVPDPRRSARSDWFPWPSWSGEERAHAQWPQLTRGRDPDLRPHLLHL